jgi:hypothetical protein
MCLGKIVLRVRYVTIDDVAEEELRLHSRKTDEGAAVMLAPSAVATLAADTNLEGCSDPLTRY